MCNLKSFLFELLCLVGIVGNPVMLHYYGLYGLGIQTVVNCIIYWLDYVLFPSTKKNFTNLRKNGFTATYVVGIMVFNALVVNILVGIILYNVDISEANVDAIWKLFINLALTEILFCGAHSILHCTKCGARTHLMHHLCIESSWSTNIIFNPLDIVAEFLPPLTILLTMHYFVWKDGFTMYLSQLVMHIWYFFGHSATLKLPHFYHHAKCNQMYSIYIKKTFQGMELVKRLFVTDKGQKHVVINKTTYDITAFAPMHPGGIQLMRTKHGEDITKRFLAVHGKNLSVLDRIKKVLPDKE